MGEKEKNEAVTMFLDIRNKIIATIVSAAIIGLVMNGYYLFSVKQTISEITRTNEIQDKKIEKIEEKNDIQDYALTELDKKVFQISVTRKNKE